jgi:ribose-phosphate pyrophosphokinase
VRDRDVIILDDEIASGGSILELLKHLRASGARSARLACTHGIFGDGAVARLAAEPDVTEIVCTNTLPNAYGQPNGKLKVLSIAPALAEAMRRINSGESVSALFEDGHVAERAAAE